MGTTQAVSDSPASSAAQPANTNTTPETTPPAEPVTEEDFASKPNTNPSDSASKNNTQAAPEEARKTQAPAQEAKPEGTQAAPEEASDTEAPAQEAKPEGTQAAPEEASDTEAPAQEVKPEGTQAAPEEASDTEAPAQDVNPGDVLEFDSDEVSADIKPGETINGDGYKFKVDSVEKLSNEKAKEIGTFVNQVEEDFNRFSLKNTTQGLSDPEIENLVRNADGLDKKAAIDALKGTTVVRGKITGGNSDLVGFTTSRFPNTIFLNEKQPDASKEDTLFHEATHIIQNNGALPFEPGDSRSLAGLGNSGTLFKKLTKEQQAELVEAVKAGTLSLN